MRLRTITRTTQILCWVVGSYSGWLMHCGLMSETGNCFPEWARLVSAFMGGVIGSLFAVCTAMVLMSTRD